MSLPVKVSRAPRPLTDGEVREARQVAQWSVAHGRFAAAWALAETTARSGEIAEIRWRDVDLSAGEVRLPGVGKVRARVGKLTDWGVTTLRHLPRQTGHQSVRVVYAGNVPASGGSASASNAVSTVLIRAGLAGRRDVRPGSVVAWAAQQRMIATGDIGEVARMLGVGSLDVAARTIGWDWTRG
ncbi:MAG: hypothetical protein AB7N61_26970 [Acidimicrobiia bacterium]